MSFETVEKLKREYTDKWVVVDPNTAELKRFVGLSGHIKTINMSGRALVQFDGPVDISWYDIDLSYLKLIDAPLPKKVADKHAEAEKKPAPAAKPAAAATGGKSPLELARAQGAAGSGAVKKSPLELAREQGAAKTAGAAPAAAPAAAAGEKPLSKLEQARLQGAAKAKAVAEASAPAAAAIPEPAAPVAPSPAVPAAAPAMVDENGKPLSKLEMARRQGAAKKAE